MITYPAVQTHPDVPQEVRERLGITDTLLRLSVGLGYADDLIADLQQALENLERAVTESMGKVGKAGAEILRCSGFSHLHQNHTRSC